VGGGSENPRKQPDATELSIKTWVKRYVFYPKTFEPEMLGIQSKAEEIHTKP